MPPMEKGERTNRQNPRTVRRTGNNYRSSALPVSEAAVFCCQPIARMDSSFPTRMKTMHSSCNVHRGRRQFWSKSVYPHSDREDGQNRQCWQMLASRERERNLLKSAKGGTYESPYSKLARYFVWNRADRRAVCPHCPHSKQCTPKNRDRCGFPEGHEGAFQLGTLG